MTKTKRLRCVIYIRVSSKMQAEGGHSLEAQLDLCQKFSASRHWDVVRVFEGEGESAKTDKRKAFQALVQFIEQGGADVVLTHKIDRFARNVVDALTYFHRWNEMGVLYASATEQFDFTTPWGKMMLVMLAAFAELFLNNLSAETSKGKRKRAEKGYWNGDLSFGYRLAADGKRAELDPETAPGVLLAFSKFSDGVYADLDIAKLLNAAGYRTRGKRGSIPFSKDTVRSMLTNVFYTGRVQYKGEIFPGQHPALIDDEIFDRCLSLRNARSLKPRAANTGTRIYPLSGLLVCEHCGRTLRGMFARNHKRVYRDPDRDYDGDCPHRSYVDALTVETTIRNLLANLTLPDAWQADILERAASGLGQGETQKRRARAEMKLMRAKELYLNGDLTGDEYDRRKREAQAELDALEPVTAPDLKRAAALLSDLGKVWDAATDEERKRLFQAMLERVVIRDGAIVVIQPTREIYPLFELVYGGPDELWFTGA